MQQEEVGRAFYLVQSGRAKVFVLDDEGKEHISATLIAGDYFGCPRPFESFEAFEMKTEAIRWLRTA